MAGRRGRRPAPPGTADPAALPVAPSGLREWSGAAGEAHGFRRSGRRQDAPPGGPSRPP
ncbi:conserved protein of unknown function [Streptantibioticus cattleyicolor NRRL 8057 = DSM 46488]|nr:conserved protein of unknown function [Streptantibioticus cattleyicolor NRRL 8057 = DSM 46488]